MSFFKKIFPKKTDEKAASFAESSNEKALEEKKTLTINKGDVFVNQQMSSKEEALRFIADKMQENNYVSADYFDALMAREEQVSTYLLNGVAIPHGIKEAKSLVAKTGLIIVQFPQGVLWQESGELVYLAVGIAANGDEHLDVLAKLTTIVMDENLAYKLGKNADIHEIMAALDMPSSQEDNQEILGDFSTQKQVQIIDEAGMHARPATLLAQMASQYKDTNIRLSYGGKAIDAKSMAAILTLGIKCGDDIVVSAEGEQAQEAVDVLYGAIAAGLDGDEEENKNANYNPLQGLEALKEPEGRLKITGSAASPGIALAKAFVFREEELQLEKNATDLEEEVKQLDKALKIASLQLKELHSQMMQKSPSEAAIFEAHLQLINDASIVETAKDIIKDGHKAAWSWDRTLKDQIAALEAIDDERIRERSSDMRDVANRVTAILENKETEFSFPKDEDFILLASELTPSQTAHLDDAPIKAIVTEKGGPNSHMAILARALGIPAIVGVGKGLIDNVQTGEISIADPQSSRFIVGPNDTTIKQAKQLILTWQNIQNIENEQKFEEAITLDGRKIDVVCNIVKPEDTLSVINNGGEGVGLLRTEFMFESASSEPCVDTQFNALKEIVESLGNKPLIIRTADIGGDKPVSWLNMPKEENPFLGVRGIRLSLRNLEMFRNQLMAIYKTALWQKQQNIQSGIHIMFPMISKLSEWQKAKEIAEDIRKELAAPQLPLGIMIEVPSAALLADHFAKEVDFFSIGSNDMTQYTLAMDRLHPELAPEADSYSPALLRLIDMTVKAAHSNGKWVGVCGNMAADADMAAILVGLGVTELSVSPANVAAVKFLIRSVSYQKLKEKAEKALLLGHSRDVHKLYENRSDLM